MKRLQAYKFQLKTTLDQEQLMLRFAGCCRFVWNKALALQKTRDVHGVQKLGYSALCKELTAWRHAEDTAFLAEAPMHPLQQSLQDLERAYQNFFEKRANVPQFKKKGRHDSFRYPDPQQFKLDEANSRVFLPKLGWVRYRKSRAITGAPKQMTLSREAGKWYISIQTAQEVEPSIHASTSTIGIDVGIARFATCSDGTIYMPTNSYRRHEAKLARYQRQLARKVHGSSNWRKLKASIQRIHAKIAQCCRDYLHKTTTAISKNHAMSVIEDLQVKAMSKSAAGAVEQPGRNVKAKSGLNKSILDQAWGTFRRQLEYKQQWRGGWVIAVPPQHTSQRCPACGHVSADESQVPSTVPVCRVRI